MSFSNFSINCGPFAKTRKDADNFCHNLFLSHAIDKCIEQMKKVEEEYKDALLRGDVELIEQKKLEIQTYRASLQLTAYMLNEVDEIST
jgi:hypothetical protein